MKKIVILSPSRYSLYSIVTTELLIRSGFCISGIFVRRLLNRKRFVAEYRRDGKRLLNKIKRKLIYRERAYRKENYVTIVDIKREEKISQNTIDDFKRKYHIPVYYCYDLNDEAVVDNMKIIKPDITIFTGGGLIREGMLQNSGAGILNCHAGVLPNYRGMDVVEWPLLEKNFDMVGITVHFMDKGLDTGDILTIKKLNIEKGDTRDSIRTKLETMMCYAMVEACAGFLNKRLIRQKQNVEDGRQYFSMHSELLKVVNNLLQNN